MSCLKLKMMDEELKNILLDEGAELFVSEVKEALKKKLREYHLQSNFSVKVSRTKEFKDFMRLYIARDQIPIHLGKPPYVSIEDWRNLMLKFNLKGIDKKNICLFSELWLDKNAAIDLERLQNACRSFKLLSTCSLCRYGNFLGGEDSTQARFINCAVDIKIEYPTYQSCTSFEGNRGTHE
ncbi:hypothetical protein [Pseudoalteromonas sp. MEBiC 03485]|uniref:hypothetical protein n=1 Tax=Pseudoalteromonas sp. MEBiC 03485 TaxID=2571103 RepID=UPI001020A83F|nr:hypothetical protein [Pseudoalteromonas sp. MEBiC 03485]RZD22218.1 hypothetical protein EVU92_09175 [Pseudoalteromonas sp. MEBiC 03485]